MCDWNAAPSPPQAGFPQREAKACAGNFALQLSNLFLCSSAGCLDADSLPEMQALEAVLGCHLQWTVPGPK